MFDKLEKYQDKLEESLFIIHYEESNEFKFDIRLNIIMKKKYGRSIIAFAKVKS